MEVINLIKGITFCLLWYFSIFFGFIALYCPLLPLMLFSNYAFRVATDKIFAFWELYPTVLLQMMFGTKIIVHGDYVDPGETALVVMNHRTRVDWNYLWLCMFHATRKPTVRGSDNNKYDIVQNGKWIHQNGGVHVQEKIYNGRKRKDEEKSGDSIFQIFKAFNQKLRLKYVLKDEIRHIPGPGWVMQLNCFTYIKRNWEYDEAEIERVVNYLYGMNYTYQLLIFPEGTDLTEQSMKKSDSFARKNNLTSYKQVLHPRTRGFTSLAQSLRPQLSAVYDISVAYSAFNTWSSETAVGSCCLKDMIFGQFPPEVHFLIKRHSVDDLPEDADDLASWLNDRWKDKEEQLESFYRYGRFIHAKNRLSHHQKGELFVALVFWTTLVIGCPIALYFYNTLRCLLFLYCFIFVMLSFTSGGFHHLEMGCYEIKNRKKKKEV